MVSTHLTRGPLAVHTQIGMGMGVDVDSLILRLQYMH